MLMPRPATLQLLIDRYDQLRALESAGAMTSEERRQLEDSAYTLCVSTGTRNIADALRVASCHCGTSTRQMTTAA
ncbi:DUF5133 domain-containing protein [Streptomyces sp. SID13666]|nr:MULTISPECIES: DUF5133 domain-containing protein [Streptomyces]MCZ4098510.1 DUF5133 domain-containing protein [Streptomyces sp. H39-C1]NEA56463.1 DUF5133 domain-containing protein [Streptomyces sp. SID13666]NEA75875.1 DUF5133 domain-containing protein [Streptomyces sp. SID13588]QNA77419.1 DUF5133 domain-containing protein [Streptomyces sp. So13.3]